MSGPAPIPKLRMSSTERRSSIVQAAIGLFAQTGFRGTTTKQLAQAIGVSEPVLYMHFATKRDLYTAIIESLAVGHTDPSQELNAIYSLKDDEAVFLKLAQVMFEWHTNYPERIRILLYSALEGHELAEIFNQSQVVPFLNAFSGYIQSRIEEGLFRKMDPLLAARSFCGMVGHYAQHIVVFRQPESEECRQKALHEMVQIFLYGVKQA